MLEAKAVEKENVLIETSRCAVTILPRLGGKIASIQVDGKELLQAPLAPYGPRNRTMSFDAADASGWDECMPSVADCTVETANGPAYIPDHGDLWRVEWQQVAQDDTSATYHGDCFSLPLRLERRLALKETSDSVTLSLDYTATNLGTSPTPWSWAAHPLFVVEEGDRILLPESIRTLRLEGTAAQGLGRSGDRVNWPVATTSAGSTRRIDTAYSEKSGIGDKLFAGPLSAADTWAILDRPSVGLSIRFGFEAQVTPYLGLWLCYGGWPAGNGPKQMCVALEPATAPVDSLAVSGPWSRVLAPGESVSWPMKVEIQTDPGGSRHA